MSVLVRIFKLACMAVFLAAPAVMVHEYYRQDAADRALVEQSIRETEAAVKLLRAAREREMWQQERVAAIREAMVSK